MKSFFSMLIVRFFFRTGEAGAFPALSKVVFNWFPMKERGIVQGINFSGARTCLNYEKKRVYEEISFGISTAVDHTFTRDPGIHIVTLNKERDYVGNYRSGGDDCRKVRCR